MTLSIVLAANLLPAPPLLKSSEQSAVKSQLALKARHSKAQGGGAREAGSGTLGHNSLDVSPVMATQITVSPLQGFVSFYSNPGFRLLCSLHPGLCCAALSALTADYRLILFLERKLDVIILPLLWSRFMAGMWLRILLIGFFALKAGAAGGDDNSFFAARRTALIGKIEGSIAVLKGAPSTYAYATFRQDNNFYYLTGVETPDAMLLIDGIRKESLLFLPPRDKQLEQWEGPRLFPGPDACRATGIEKVLGITEFADELKKRSKDLEALYIPQFPIETEAVSRDRALNYESAIEDDHWEGRITREEALEQHLKAMLRSVKIKNLCSLLDEMRRIKDLQEIERLRTAGKIGALGFKEALRSLSPGMYEYQIAAIARLVFSWNGASWLAFNPIVGSGPNSCILHYNENRRRISEGDIVVMDFGPDYRYYASDITRTFPVSGKFSNEQATAYQIVLDSQKAAIAKIRPGANFGDLNDEVKKILNRHGYEKYLIHGVSHYVGMATHDVGRNAPFEPGVVITIEPGIYISDKNLGIRIEDTVLVTKDGCEILTEDLPKEISEIENLIAEKGIAERMKN
jgi:Xaa-Pro aminopeptidase